MWKHAHGRLCHSTYVEVRRELVGVNFLLPSQVSVDQIHVVRFGGKCCPRTLFVVVYVPHLPPKKRKEDWVSLRSHETPTQRTPCLCLPLLELKLCHPTWPHNLLNCEALWFRKARECGSFRSTAPLGHQRGPSSHLDIDLWHHGTKE